MRRPLLNILLPLAIGVLVVALWYAVRYALTEDLKFLLPHARRDLGGPVGQFRITRPRHP